MCTLRLNQTFIKAVFFDFDGTLADTAPDMVGALNDWLASYDRPPVDVTKAIGQVSGGSRALLAFAGLNGIDEQIAREEYLDLYEKTQYTGTTLFAGVDDMLAEVVADGLVWGVVTNKPRRYFAPIADNLCLQEKGARALLAAGDAGQAKPHPDMLLAAAQRCALRPEECIYVGDDVRDGQAAKAAGMKFIIAAWGYWRGECWNNAAPTAAIISSPTLLKTILKTNL